jgi:serine/threonine protein kinase
VLSSGYQRVLILTERRQNVGNLVAWLIASEAFAEDVAKGYMQQLLSALSALHEAGICHKGIEALQYMFRVMLTMSLDNAAVTLGNLMVDLSEPRQPLLKLLGTGYHRTLSDMNRSNPFADVPADTQPPDTWYALSQSSFGRFR